MTKQDSDEPLTSTSQPSRETSLHDPALTRRSLTIAVVLTLIAGLWVRQSEVIVLATQITESVPAIPGLAALTLLIPLNALLKRIEGVRPLSQGEILVIFLMVTVSSMVMGVGVTQFLFTLMGIPYYFKNSDIPSLRKLLPDSLLVHNTEAIRQMYEKSPTGTVPWGLWLQPCVMWLFFFVALWCALYCMMALFYRAWSRQERLLFPQTVIPIELTSDTGSEAVPFYQNKALRAGILVAAIYNGINIAHAFVPDIPALGSQIKLNEMFPSAPWSEMAPLSFYFRPELIGLGYLVSTEISLTVWLSFTMMKLAAVFGVSIGAAPQTLPYSNEQGMGAYIALAIVLVWVSRRPLLDSIKSAIRGDSEIGPEGITCRTAVLGLLAGFAAVWAFMSMAGMAAWTSLAYLLIIMSVALVYGRLRAEAGVPMMWLFPFQMQKKALLYAFGSAPFVAAGARNLPTWALFTVVGRGYFTAITGYQVEGMELSRRSNSRSSRFAIAALIAVALGVFVGWYIHLTPYYAHGSAQLREMWGDYLAEPEYVAAAQYPHTPLLPDFHRTMAMSVGGILVVILWALRVRFAGFWFHPLGYAMSCCAGDLIWSSFLIVWLVKSITLKYGGIRHYRRSAPFFLGLAFGHFAIAGVFWGLFGAWSGQAVRGYPVFFG